MFSLIRSVRQFLRGIGAVSAAIVLLAACNSSDYRPGSPPEDGFSVMSLNIHYLVPENDGSDWNRRKHAVAAAVEELSPEVLLFQEMETFSGGHAPQENRQLDWVLQEHPSYAVGAYGDPKEFPITQPILYNPDRFAPVDQGFFFFSDTPDRLYAEPWDGSWPAFASWVVLDDRTTGRLVAVYNVHLDAYSRQNRRRGAALTARRIASRSPAGSAVIVAGDLNVRRRSAILEPLRDLGLVLMDTEGSSFHFGRGWHLFGAIDHIFHDESLSVLEGGVIQRAWAGTWPSDHHPIVAVFRWTTP